MRKIFIFVTFLLSMFSAQIFMQEIRCDSFDVDYSSLNFNDDKVYISSDQLICSDNGIFILLQDSNGILAKTSVPQVNYDDNGLFVLATNIPLPQALMRCPNGHPRVCPKQGCMGCGNSKCPHRCRGH